MMGQAITLETAAGVLCRQSTLLLVVLFGAGKVVEHMAFGEPWRQFGPADVVTLVALAVAISAVAWAAHARSRHARAASALPTEEGENEAVIRVARAVACELAQPLSGALGYSELLMMRADHLTDQTRRELEGLREGVLQMERLLQSLRQAVEGAPSMSRTRRVADHIESCISAPRPRLMVHGLVATVQVDGSDRR